MPLNRKKSSSIFLSHSHKDRSFTSRLAADLTKEGVRVWLDEAELRVGDSLIERLGTAIAETDYLGVVLTRHSVRSAWVRKEVSIALTQEVHSRRVRVLPILAGKCSVPTFLRNKVYADLSTSVRYDSGLPRLLKLLGRRRKAVRTLTANDSVPSHTATKVLVYVHDDYNGGYLQVGEWTLRSDVSNLTRIYFIDDSVCFALKVPKQLGLVYDYTIFDRFHTEQAEDRYRSVSPWIEVYIGSRGRSREDLEVQGESIVAAHNVEVERCWKLVGRGPRKRM